MLRRALSYIQNTGGKISTRFFDEDHEPIGPDLRARLREHDLIKVDHNGNITISARGEQVLRDMKDE